MQNNNKLLGDLSRLAGSAAGSLMDMKKEVDAMVAAQLEKLLQNMNLATKEEWEATQAMLAKLRTEQEELKKRVLELELCIKELTGGKESTK